VSARPQRVTIAGQDPQTVDAKASSEDERPADAGAADTPPAARAAIVGAVGSLDRDGRRRVEVVIDGWRFEAIVEDEARAALRDRASRDRPDAMAAGGPLEIRAIIPGRVVQVRVTVDDAVEADEALLVVEAMKMQNELRSPRAGTVARVEVAAGMNVEVGDLLVVIG